MSGSRARRFLEPLPRHPYETQRVKFSARSVSHFHDTTDSEHARAFFAEMSEASAFRKIAFHHHELGRVRRMQARNDIHTLYTKSISLDSNGNRRRHLKRASVKKPMNRDGLSVVSRLSCHT